MNRIDLLELVPRHSRGAELGVCVGDYSREILARVDPELFYLVDVWRHIDLGYADKLMGHDGIHQKRYRGVWREFGFDPRVRIIRDLSLSVREIFPEHSLDWIYIDGDHSRKGCWDDLVTADQVVKPGGLIMGHDHDAKHPGVIEAVAEFVNKRQYHLVLTTDDDVCPSYLIVRDAHHRDRIQHDLDQRTKTRS